LPASSKASVLQALVQRLGGSFARSWEIQLAEGDEKQLFRWFLAAFLYGARISESIAARTYQEFRRRNVLTPEAIEKTGWDGLVQILDAGGYARYDFSTATKLLTVAADLIADYDGRLSNVHSAAENSRDLEQRLQKIGKGIGPVTANIFLRELRGIWPKADPLLSDPAVLAARHLNLLPSSLANPERMLAALKTRWEKAGMPAHTFIDCEAALVRIGLHYCRKSNKHKTCPLSPWCPASTGTG